MRSGDATGRTIGFKWIHSFPDSVFLRLAFLHFACPGEPLGTKGLIRLPDFHSRGLDEVRPYSRQLSRRRAEFAGRSRREPNGRHTKLPQSLSPHLSPVLP